MIPLRPLSGEKENAYYRPANEAIKCPLIAPHTNCLRKVMAFDLDYPHSYFLPEERGLPEPSFISVSKGTGRAHACYILDRPVSFFDNSRQGPIEFFRDVELGYRNRLTADPRYNGLMVKNPFHERYDTHWQAVRHYRLDELRDSLDRDDIKRTHGQIAESAIGRNCTVFDTVREVAYREVLKFKNAGKTINDFLEAMIKVAQDVNGSFDFKLSYNELRCTALSVTKWVWRKFTKEKFSIRQSLRGQRRWLKVETLTTTKPWELEGISRRTWERRRSKGVIPDMATATLPDVCFTQ